MADDTTQALAAQAAGYVQDPNTGQWLDANIVKAAGAFPSEMNSSQPASTGLQQYDSQGNPYTPPANAGGQFVNPFSAPSAPVAQYDSQGNEVDPSGNVVVPAAQVNDNVSNPDGTTSAATPPAAPEQPAAPAQPSGAASVPVPSNLTFSPQGAVPAPTAPAAPSNGGGGGGGGVPGGYAKIANQTALDQADAIKAQEAVDTEKAKGQLAVGQNESNQYASTLVQRQAAMQQAWKQADDALAKSKQVANQFLNQQIDPNRYWGSMGTGDKALAGLSMILSGIGSGVTGQPNLAVKHFDDAVTNDIAAQRYNIEHGKEASEMYSKLSSDFQAAGLSKQHALDATDLAIKQKALTDASNQALQLGGKQAQATAAKELAPLAMQAQKDTQDLTHGVLANKLIGAQTTQAYAAAAKDRAEAGAIPGKNAAALQGREVRGPDGSLGIAASPEAVKDFNTEAKPAQDIQQALDAIDQARKTGVWQDQAQLQALAGNLRMAVAGLGDIKESQRTEEIIDNMVGDPTQFFSIKPGSSWSGRESALRQIAGNRLEGAAARHNVQWVKPPASSIPQTPVGTGG